MFTDVPGRRLNLILLSVSAANALVSFVLALAFGAAYVGLETCCTNCVPAANGGASGSLCEVVPQSASFSFFSYFLFGALGLAASILSIFFVLALSEENRKQFFIAIDSLLVANGALNVSFFIAALTVPVNYGETAWLAPPGDQLAIGIIILSCAFVFSLVIGLQIRKK